MKDKELIKKYTSSISTFDFYYKEVIKSKHPSSLLLTDLKNRIINDNSGISDKDFYAFTHMLDNYTVDLSSVTNAKEEYDLFFKLRSSFYSIQSCYEKLREHVYHSEIKIKNKIENYQYVTNKINVDISPEIEEINNAILNYQNSKIYHIFKKDCQDKIKIVIDLYECLSKIDIESFKVGLKHPQMLNKSFIGQNYPTDFRKSPELAELVTLIDKAREIFTNNPINNKAIIDLKDIFKLIDDADISLKKIHDKIRSTGYKFNLANHYQDEQEDRTVLGFLNLKVEQTQNVEQQSTKRRINEIDFPESSKIEKLFIFEDGSSLVKKQNGYQGILSDQEILNVRKQLINECINESFKKNPTTAKKFKEMSNSVYIKNFYQFLNIMNKYKENENILKINNFDLLKSFKEIKLNHDKNSEITVYEKIDDNISKVIRDHKIRNYIHSISSNKYDNLYNEDTYKIAAELYDLKLPSDVLQDYIGKKLAAFKQPEEFNNALKQFADSLNSFTMEATVKKAETFGVQLISNTENILILKIKDFTQSEAMGSSSWCISRDEEYFKSYADDREQYFLFDFTKDKIDNSSIIGVTLEKNGTYHAAHYKDDEECEEEQEDLIQYLQEKVKKYKNDVEIKSNNKTALKI